MKKPAGSKLINFKKWLTLPEVENRLSDVCDEKVTEADILTWALDGHLKLSVYFTDGIYARGGHIGEREHVNDGIARRGLVGGWKYVNDLCSSFEMGENRYLNLEKDITELKDVWDLLMIGDGRYHVACKYQELSGLPATYVDKILGIFLEREGQICMLHAHIDDDKYTGVRQHNWRCLRSVLKNAK